MDIPLERLCIAPASGSSPLADVALIDFGSPPGAGGPLIDLLVNTPDTDRNATAKLPPNMGQVRRRWRAVGSGLGWSRF